MTGTSKSKQVVTSGRLTGRVGSAAPTGRRLTPNPRPGARPDPAYSLYSTESEDQVTSLHKGLDRCAALLSGLLQADQSEPPLSPPKAEAAKRRPSTSLGKKSVKKMPKQKARPPAAHRSPVPAAHLGVRLHPPLKRPDGRQRRSPTALRRRTSDPLEGPAPDRHPAEAVSAEDEEVPVRDVGPQGSTAGVRGHAPRTPRPGTVHEVPQGNPRGGENGRAGAGTAQRLLGELKALIAGRGSAAEKLLSHLETMLSSPPTNDLDTQTGPDVSALQSQNAQLRMCVKTLQQQLNEAGTPSTLRKPQALALHEELAVAQSRLRELQEDLAGLREALKNTQDQLGRQEAENVLMKTELEATKSRLVDFERKKSDLASLAKQRLEQIGLLNRTLQGRSLPCPKDTYPAMQRFDRRGSDPESPAARVAHYLRSLSQEQTLVQPRDPLPHPNSRQDRDSEPAEASDRRVGACRRPETERLSLCGSAWSGWSARSGSTFDTRDEVAFRDGLVALDASIANLQKTIQLDLGR